MKVGDTLQQLLRDKWKIQTCGRCHETALKMNQLGVAGCREKIEELAEELHQNAKSQKWTGLMSAAVKFTDKITHAVSGNALYRSVILSVCDRVELESLPCKYRGRRHGNALFRPASPLYECRNDLVPSMFCVSAETNIERARLDNCAVCASCEHQEKELKK